MRSNQRQLVTVPQPSGARAVLGASSNSTTGGGGSNSGNLLLDQMNMVLASWKGEPLGSANEPMSPSQRQHQQQQSLGTITSTVERDGQVPSSSTAVAVAGGELSLRSIDDSSSAPAIDEAQHRRAAEKRQQQILQQQQREQQQEQRRIREQWVEDAVTHNVETCRSALMLYSSAAGKFAPNLKKVSDYLVDVIQHLASEHALQRTAIRNMQRAGAGGDSHATKTIMMTIDGDDGDATTTTTHQQHGGPASQFTATARAAADAGAADEEGKCEYAFSRLEHAKDKMRQMVAESRRVQDRMEHEAAALAAKLERAETQLEYQILRMRKADTTRMDREEFERERSLLECNKQLDREKERVRAANRENDELRAKIAELLELNTQFARQAIELGARVRVYADHNERLATHLGIITEERLLTDRENEMIRAELLDLNRFHQLKDQFDSDTTASKAGRCVDLRPTRHGVGANSTKPRHLQSCNLVNRLNMTRNTVTAIVADVLMRRKVQLANAEATGASATAATDLSTFFREYVARKHGAVDSVPWCYGVDEACTHFDEDSNLLTFQLVISGKLSELVYKDEALDIAILMGACEVLDEASHAEAKLLVSLGDIVGLLVELFPGYPDSQHRKLVELLMTSVTSSSSQVHYRMLFPNLERQEISSSTEGILSQSELRAESAFSTMFKHMFVDDVMMTTQAFEDAIFDAVTTERVTWTDICTSIGSIFDEASAVEVLAMFRKVLVDAVPGALDGFAITKHQLMQTVRRRMLLRRGPFRAPAQDTAPKRARLLLSSIGRSSDSALQHVATEAGLSDFRAAINKVPVRRVAFSEEETNATLAKKRRRSMVLGGTLSGVMALTGAGQPSLGSFHGGSASGTAFQSSGFAAAS